MKAGSRVVYRNTTPPCVDCSDRSVGCHGSCSKFKEWKGFNISEFKKVYSKVRKENIVNDFQVDNAVRIKRKSK